MRFLLLFLFLFSFLYGFPEGEVIISNSEQKEIDLVGSLFYVVDSSEALTFDQILSDDFTTNLIQSDRSVFYFPNSAKAHWFLLDIKNESDEYQFYIFSVNNPLVENITFYSSIDGNYQNSGTLFPFLQRKFFSNLFVFPLSIPPGKSFKICLHVAAQNRALYLPLSLTEGNYYLTKLRQQNLFNGMIYSVWILMIVILLVLWRSEKDISFLYYFGIAFLVGLLKFWRDGLLSKILFSESPLLVINLDRVFYAAIFLLLFLVARVRLFPELKKTKTYSFLKILAWISATYTVSLFFVNSFMYYRIVGSFLIVAFVAVVISRVKFLSTDAKTNKKQLIVAILTLIAGLVMSYVFGFDTKGVGLFDWSVWVLVLVMLFGLTMNILVYKFYLAREEVYTLNRDLEIKVQERTSQINAQKEELRQQHEAMLQQKESLQSHREELRARKELLQLKNTELEKLSLVASKTNNLIYIFDPDGDLDWYNASYAQLIGKTNEEYKNSKQTINIMEMSTNKNIRHIINTCLREKTVVSYESTFEMSNGAKKWFHTTLTPILDDRDNIRHLIAIDTDITQLKEYEAAVESQRKDAENQKNIALRRKEELELQQLEITDSIRYAKRIQTAIMPSFKQIMRDFSDHFVLFLPKDIVSGDFYWYHRIRDKYFIAAVDCTGHGVPGAFMSIIGNYLLNSIIIHNGVEKPSEILKQLNRKIKISLKSDIRDQASDGMDIAIAVLDKKDGSLQFASALRPLYLFNNGSFLEIKGDKAPITSNITGTMLSNYTNYELKLNEGDVFYMFSDGIIDQFGGKKGKKFLTKRFKQLLFEINPLSMREQKEIIKNAFDEWKGSFDQVDDVLVMGIRYNSSTTIQTED